MDAKKKKISQRDAVRPVHAMVEDVVGCKWSTQVLQLVRQGVERPGGMRQAVPGLTAKVLSERLRKLVRFGIVRRVVYPEIPPHVEYKLTPFGEQFAGVLDAIEKLSRRWESSRSASAQTNHAPGAGARGSSARGTGPRKTGAR